MGIGKDSKIYVIDRKSRYFTLERWIHDTKKIKKIKPKKLLTSQVDFFESIIKHLIA
jgi:hypothetical protein